MKDLYSENYKTLIERNWIQQHLMKEIEYCAHGLEDLILFKCLSYTRKSADLCHSYQNINSIFHRTGKNGPKICMEPKRPQIAKRTLKKDKVRGITFPGFSEITEL